MAELAEEEFLRAKTAKMLACLMERKFEKHVLKYSVSVRFARLRRFVDICLFCKKLIFFNPDNM